MIMPGEMDDTLGKIVEMNYDGSDEELLMQILSPEKGNQINEVYGMELSEDGSCIFLSGAYFESAEAGEDGEICIGVLDRESLETWIYPTGLTFYQEFENACLYYEGFVEYGTEAGGTAAVLYTDGKEETITFDEKWQSQCLFISDKGNYLGAYADPETGAKENMVSLYDRATEEPVADIVFDHVLYEMIICEDSHTVYGFYYDNGETEIEAETF